MQQTGRETQRERERERGGGGGGGGGGGNGDALRRDNKEITLNETERQWIRIINYPFLKKNVLLYIFF